MCIYCMHDYIERSKAKSTQIVIYTEYFDLQCKALCLLVQRKVKRLELLKQVLLPSLKITVNVLRGISLAQLHDGGGSHLLQQLISKLKSQFLPILAKTTIQTIEATYNRSSLVMRIVVISQSEHGILHPRHDGRVAAVALHPSEKGFGRA